MAERTVWKGHIKLSLVSCAVGLYPSTSSGGKIRFNTLNRKTGNRVKRQFIDSETEEVVESEDQVKGFVVGKGSYIQVEDEELDALKLESTHTIDIESFVPREEVDERFLDTAYYIAPADKVSNEAFCVIRDAIRDKGMAGIARIVLARRERMILLEPLDEGLVGTTLHAADEVRNEDKVFDEISEVKYPKEMKDLAAHIIDSKAAHFDPKQFDDRYEEAVAELLKSKQAGKPLKEEPSEKPSNVVNLMDAFKRSVSAEKAGSAGKKSAPAKKAAAKKAPKKPAPKAKARKAG
ncbi:non-homologous end joining protein Ku [Microvirga lotononidis]|uniref:Non-homologous end joining protein Ku n=1 Tax=Microvirga lotononidis TaxID=864069 RepID=I4YQL5_9HYPH|nr:Ku protein [Microvirga lotononidis]EIM26257.1 Ku protein [Microvirga lotononidis]WQO30635.1 Ku protein [Microvirga lotononidis]